MINLLSYEFQAINYSFRFSSGAHLAEFDFSFVAEEVGAFVDDVAEIGFRDGVVIQDPVFLQVALRDFDEIAHDLVVRKAVRDLAFQTVDIPLHEHAVSGFQTGVLGKSGGSASLGLLDYVVLVHPLFASYRGQ